MNCDYVVYALECAPHPLNPLCLEQRYMGSKMYLAFEYWEGNAKPLKSISERHLIPDENWCSPPGTSYKVGNRDGTRYHSLQHEIAGEQIG